MEFIDTHAHTYMIESDDLCRQSIERALASGVKKQIMAGVDREGNAKAKELCKKYKGIIYRGIGLHPTEVFENYREEFDHMQLFLEEAFKDEENSCVAIGETGLDFYRDRTFEKEQEWVFRQQIELAKAYKLPLILHIRAAFAQSCAILKEYQDGSLSGVFHCFGGSVEEAKMAIDLGFKLGIGGVVTFKNASLAKTVKVLDLEHLVLETDAPFLAPHPYRGQENESSYLPLVAHKIAEIKDFAVETVAQATTNNAKSLFRLD